MKKPSPVWGRIDGRDFLLVNERAIGDTRRLLRFALPCLM
jgi:hypothetical protein